MSTTDEMGLTPAAAKGYEEFFVPAIFDHWAPVMLAAADVRKGENVLDVGCGTGVLTRELPQIVGDAGSATGLDLSESMLGVARERCPGATFHQGNVAALPFEDQTFDVAISSFMLMFVPEPDQALREMRRVLKPGGRVAVSVWRGLEDNVVYRNLVEAAREVAGDDSASSLARPFAMGEAGNFESILKSAGLGDVAIRQHDGEAKFPSVEDFVATEIQAWLLADALAKEQIEAIANRLRAKYPPFEQVTGSVCFPLNALVGKASST